ncbi:MAG: putative bifunctional diguanylate cyclase/phosphodiesterase [Solirubrobacterales bacterium]
MIGRLGNLLQTNVAVWLTALVAAAGVVGAGFGVLSIAHQEDRLREAETGLAELSNLATGLEAQAEAALDRDRPTRSDVRLHRRIGGLAERSARKVERLWEDPLVAGIARPIRDLAAASGMALQRAAEEDRLGVAESLGLLAGRAGALRGRIGSARQELAGRIETWQSEAKLLTFGLSGAIALALVALIVTVATLRRRGMIGRNQREAAELGERRLRALVRHGSDMITVLDPDGTVLYEAGAVHGLLGYEPAELEGRKLSAWLHPGDAAVLAALCNVGGSESPPCELRLRHRDGSYRTCEARAASLSADEPWDGIVLNVWDVTERKLLEQRLRHQAFHDSLTSLPNRVLFNERLQHALVRGVRAGCAVSVLLIDLDDFKSINDSLGHPVGDELLRATARRLDEEMRGADTVARLSGDEFGVILDGTASIAEDERAATRILAAMAKPFELSAGSFPLSASIGISRAEPGEGCADRLVRDADLAMYAAKSEQKGTLAVFREDMHVANEERLQLKTDLVHGLDAGEQLELHYQPVVALADGSVVGLEALLRWNHPRRGLIGPAEFVPLAEETGTILAIGRWALRRACAEARTWVERGAEDLFVSVNVSARQLREDALADHVAEALRESGLAPQRLLLELTETQLMHDVEQAVAVLHAVKRLGVRIAIDDFGSGYSSLSQLQRLPVDVLKVDRQLASTSQGRAESGRMLTAVIELADSLGLRTIAEGIETPEQLRQLRALRYAYGQGFLFSRPVPTDAVAALLAAPAYAATAR